MWELSNVSVGVGVMAPDGTRGSIFVAWRVSATGSLTGTEDWRTWGAVSLTGRSFEVVLVLPRSPKIGPLPGSPKMAFEAVEATVLAALVIVSILDIELGVFLGRC